MTTLVGTQDDFAEALKALIGLDYDTIFAYQKTTENLKSPSLKDQLALFKKDYQRQVLEMSYLLQERGILPPTGADSKTLLTGLKAHVTQLFGDKAMMSAMLSNEDNISTAYARMNERPDRWPDTVEVLERGLEDAQFHHKWLQEQKILCDTPHNDWPRSV